MSRGGGCGRAGDARAADLTVHSWTFRRENRFLPTQWRSGPDPEAPGKHDREVRAFIAAGMDGFFTDNRHLGAMAAAG